MNSAEIVVCLHTRFCVRSYKMPPRYFDDIADFARKNVYVSIPLFQLNSCLSNITRTRRYSHIIYTSDTADNRPRYAIPSENACCTRGRKMHKVAVRSPAVTPHRPAAMCPLSGPGLLSLKVLQPLQHCTLLRRQPPSCHVNKWHRGASPQPAYDAVELRSCLYARKVAQRCHPKEPSSFR